MIRPGTVSDRYDPDEVVERRMARLDYPDLARLYDAEWRKRGFLRSP